MSTRLRMACFRRPTSWSNRYRSRPSRRKAKSNAVRLLAPLRHTASVRAQVAGGGQLRALQRTDQRHQSGVLDGADARAVDSRRGDRSPPRSEHDAINVEGPTHVGHSLRLPPPERERDLDDELPLRDEPPLRDRLRCGFPLPFPSPSSSSPVSLSFTPSIAPFVFDSAPPEVIDSISWGSPSD